MKRSRDPIIWGLLIGFLTVYVGLFVLPTFLNDSQKMMFRRYIPTLPRTGYVGTDAKSIHFFVRAWLDGEDPYTVDAISNGVFYPPLSLLLLSPLGLASTEGAYLIAIWATVPAFVVLALLLPIGFGRRLAPMTLLFFATGLFSYGFQFELERGQFNVVAFCLSYLAIYLVHFHGNKPGWRYLSYALLTAAIQIKIFPAIFALGLVTNWSDWKGNLRRLGILAGANLLLLYALGHQIFTAFIRSFTLFMTSTVMGEKINHSAASFVIYASDQVRAEALSGTLPTWVTASVDHSGWLQLLLLAVCVAIILVVVLCSARRRSGSIAYVLLAITLGALLIPSRSFDYTLAALPAAMAIFVQQLGLDLSPTPSARSVTARRWIRFGTMILMSVAYFWTIFSYTSKPDVFYLNNNFPALLLMLVLTPLLAFI